MEILEKNKSMKLEEPYSNDVSRIDLFISRFISDIALSSFYWPLKESYKKGVNDFTMLNTSLGNIQ